MTETVIQYKSKFIDDKAEILGKIDDALIRARNRGMNGNVHIIINIFNGGIGRTWIETLETEIVRK